MLEALRLAILATRQAIAAETGGPFVRLALIGTETVLLRRVAEIRRAMEEEEAIAEAGAVAGEAPPARPLPRIVYARPPRRRR